MKGMILAAGLGTRLRPLTHHWPKPAMPVLGQPLLRYALSLLHRAGIRQVGLNTHHLAERMRATAEVETARLGMSLTAVHEPVIQGTGGGIRGLRGLLRDEPFVVLNGDVLFAVDLRPIVEAHQASGAAATMVLMPLPAGEKYAAVELDAAQRVRRIAGHGPGGEGLTPWHFTGVHVMSPVVFDFMSPEGPEDINREVYVRMLERGLTIRGELVSASQVYWSDLGTPARLAATHSDLLHGRVPLSLFGAESPFANADERSAGVRAAPSARLTGAELTGPLFFAEGAEVEAGARLGPEVSVGLAAKVRGGAVLSRSLVLDEAAVEAGEVLDRCIVLPGAVGDEARLMRF